MRTKYAKPPRKVKRKVMQENDITSGRQWTKYRKALNRARRDAELAAKLNSVL